ncbi:MAG: hypothetical protein GIW98_00400 [Candidatus Eremiobacteraeota bacterium]|nr:hypothetical protein [Candidatus Eremiobacteraeota bacterium]
MPGVTAYFNRWTCYAEAQRRAAQSGPTVVRHGRAGPLRVLISHLANPLLLLLAVTAAISLLLHQSTDAIIIVVIVAMSVALWVFQRISFAAGRLGTRPATAVSADIRLIDMQGLECDSAVLSGEGLPTTKTTEPVSASGDRWSLRLAHFPGRSCGQAARTVLSSEPGAIRLGAEVIAPP